MRIQPTGFAVFPEYDLRAPVRLACASLAQTGLPVPRMRWLEADDTSVFGAPFYVMSKVAGRAAADRPLYTRGGLAEGARARRPGARSGGAGSSRMAAIHQLDWRALGFGFVDKPELGTTGLDQQLAYYERYLRWTARGKPQPIAEAALGVAAEEQARRRAATHSSGATRASATSCSSRTARRRSRCSTGRWSTHGNGEEDLAWAIFLDRHHSEGIGLPRLPGFPSYADTIARYEELTGRKTRWQKFYSVFAGFRFAVIMSRIAQQMVHYGVHARGLDVRDEQHRHPAAREGSRACPRRADTMTHAHRHFVPAAGSDWLLPFYDPFTRLMGTGPALRELVAQAGLVAGQRVLDLGCGTGATSLVAKLAQPGVDLVGLDPDPKALARARRKATRAGVAIAFEQGFGDALPFPAASFDRVLSSFMFHHLESAEKPAVLRELRRVLRPGGSLHIVDFGGAGHGLGALLARLVHREESLRANTDEALALLMRAAGFAEAAQVGQRGSLLGALSYYRARV